MKPLLFFLLMSFACQGQSDSVNMPIMTGSLFDSKMNTFLTVEKLLQYAEECWNDSTAKETHRVLSNEDYTCTFIGKGSTRCIHESHWLRQYIHRKPTFENFLEWLRNKRR